MSVIEPDVVTPTSPAPIAGRGVRQRSLARLRKWWTRLVERLARRTFELRIWNDIDPKDPQPLTLFLGEPAALKEQLLSFYGDAYLELDARNGGLELYSPWGLRVTNLRPLWLYLLAVRNATLFDGPRHRQSLMLALRIGLCGVVLSLLAAQVWDRSLLTRTLASINFRGGSFSQQIAQLGERCPAHAPCEVSELEAEGIIDSAFARRLGRLHGVMIPGFRGGSSQVPESYLPVLVSSFSPESLPSCREILLLARASPNGPRSFNLELAHRRAEAVRQRVEAARPGAHRYTTLLAWRAETVRIDLARLRQDLANASISFPDNGDDFERYAQRSVQLFCVGTRANARL